MSTEHPPTDGDQPAESDSLSAQDDRPTAESASSPAAAESREWRPVAPSGGAPRRPLPPAVKYGGLGLLALLVWWVWRTLSRGVRRLFAPPAT